MTSHLPYHRSSFSGHHFPALTKLRQKSQIIFKKQSQIIDSETQYGHTLDTEPEGKPGVMFIIDPGVRKYLRMYHAAPHDLYPSRVTADTTPFAIAYNARHIHLSRWFRKREIRRPKPDLQIAFEKRPQEITYDSLEIGQ
jgi:hypothetical protein